MSGGVLRLQSQHPQFVSKLHRMAPNSALGSRCNALRRKFKALVRSIRTSMAPIPPQELKVTGRGLRVSKSLERHIQQLTYGSLSSLRCMASSVADTAGGLACCIGPPAVTEAWENNLERLESDEDYTRAHGHAYVSRADFMAGSSKKPLLHVILAAAPDEATVGRTDSEADSECIVTDCNGVKEGDSITLAGTQC